MPSTYPPNEWWANRNMLVNAVKDFGNVYGFKANSPKQCIRCSREGATTTKRNYISGSLRCECTFILYLKSKHTMTILRQGGKKKGEKIRFVIGIEKLV